MLAPQTKQTIAMAFVYLPEVDIETLLLQTSLLWLQGVEKSTSILPGNPLCATLLI